LQKIVDGVFAVIEKKEAGHPFALMATQYMQNAFDTVGMDALVVELGNLGITVTNP